MSPFRRTLLKALLLTPFGRYALADAGAPFSVSYFDDYAPYSSGTDLSVHGLFIDVIQEVIGRRLGVPIEQQGKPWLRAQALVTSGKSDALVTTATEERLRIMSASREDVFTGQLHYYVSARHPALSALQNLRTVEDAKPYLIGTYRGAGWVLANMPQHRMDMATNLGQCLRKAASLRVDIVPEIATQARRVIEDLKLEGEVIELPSVIGELHYKLLIRQQSAYISLLPRFDAAIKAMRADGSLQKIYDRYHTSAIPK